MLPIIPTPKTQIQTSNESQIVINDNELLMMCPVECHIPRILKHVMVRMPHYFDVAISRLPFFAQPSERMLRVRRIAADGLIDLLVDHDVDFDSSFGSSFENLVEPPFLIVEWRTTQE